MKTVVCQNGHEICDADASPGKIVASKTFSNWREGQRPVSGNEPVGQAICHCGAQWARALRWASGKITAEFKTIDKVAA